MPANSAADPVKSGRPFLYEVAHGSAVWKPHYGRIYDIVAFATLFIYLFTGSIYGMDYSCMVHQMLRSRRVDDQFAS